MRKVAEIEAKVNERSRRWGMRKLVEREKTLLKAKIAFNKMLRIIQDRVKREQNFFMEGVFSAAAEGDWELEELLKSSARNSLSNESRFSTIWRNRNSSSGYNRTSYQSSSGNPLKGLDTFLQQVLDKASQEKESKNANYSMRSGQDEYRGSSKGVKKATDEDRYSLGMHLATPADTYLAKVEKETYNKVAKKSENILNQGKEREGKKIERLLLLERDFTQLARIMKAIRLRNLIVSFNELTKIHLLHEQAEYLRGKSEAIDEDLVIQDDYIDDPGWGQDERDYEYQADIPQAWPLAIQATEEMLQELVGRRQAQSLYCIRQCQIEEVLQARIIQAANLTAEDDWKQDLTVALIGKNEELTDIVENSLNDPSGNRFFSRTIMLNHFLDRIFSSRRQSILIALFESIYENEEVKVERNRALNMMNYYSEVVTLRYTMLSLAENCVIDQERENSYHRLFSVMQQHTINQTRDALNRLYTHKETTNIFGSGLDKLNLIVTDQEFTQKSDAFAELKSIYKIDNIRRAIQKLSFMMTRSEVISLATSMKIVMNFGIARVKLARVLEVSYFRTRESFLADLVTGMIDAQYQKQKRLDDYNLEQEDSNSEYKESPSEVIQVIEWEHTQQERTRTGDRTLPHASKPYSVLPLLITMHEFRTKCSAFNRVAEKAKIIAGKDAAVDKLFDSLPTALIKDSFSKIRKHHAADSLTVLSGEVINSQLTNSYRSIKLSKASLKNPKKKLSQVKLQNKQGPKLDISAQKPVTKRSALPTDANRPPRMVDKSILIDRVYTISSANDHEPTHDEKSEQAYEYEPILKRKRLYPKQPSDIDRPTHGTYVSYKLSTRLQAWHTDSRPPPADSNRRDRASAKFAGCLDEDSVDRSLNGRLPRYDEDRSSKYVIKPRDGLIHVSDEYQNQEPSHRHRYEREQVDHTPHRTIQKSYAHISKLGSSQKTIVDNNRQHQILDSCTVCVNPQISVCHHDSIKAACYHHDHWQSSFMKHRNCQPHAHVATRCFPPQNLNNSMPKSTQMYISSNTCHDRESRCLTNFNCRLCR